MADNPNVNPPPPPLLSPMVDERRLCTVPWQSFFSSLSAGATQGALGPGSPSPPAVPPGPGTICAVNSSSVTLACYNPATIGARNLASFAFFQNQIAVGLPNPWDFACINGGTLQWPQISQMLIINGLPAIQPSWLNPGNWPGPVGNPLDPSIGFIAAGFPSYDPIGVYLIHKLSICGGFDGN